MSLADLLARAAAKKVAEIAIPSEKKAAIAATETIVETKLTGLAAMIARKSAEVAAKAAVEIAAEIAAPTQPATAMHTFTPNRVAAQVEEMRSVVEKTHNKSISEVYANIAPEVVLDESQAQAVAGMIAENYACLVGYAGTGKTTTLRALVAALMENISAISIGSLGHLSNTFNGHECRSIPAIAFAAFTGRAAKQMAGSLPDCFRQHCSTIHRLLGFRPEFYEAEILDDNGRFLGTKQSMRMIPTHNKHNKMPWRVIVIDEASMVGLDLWELFIDAVDENCRIYMVGDLSQLPPVFGDAIFGMAIHKWPTFELSKIHRQAEGSPIIANAARIRHGEKPEKAEQFQMKGIEIHPQTALKQVVDFVKLQHGAKLYDEMQDIVITATNVGAVGQEVMNAILRAYFNPNNEMQLIYAGREKMRLAVGDRVMFTGKNNWQLGITNGEIGIVRDVRRNPDYNGPDPDIDQDLNINTNSRQQEISFGDMNALIAQTQTLIDEASKRRNEQAPEDEDEDSSGKRQSSHIVVVEFPALDRTFDLKDTGSVAALKHAYAITCHKSQGGQWRNVYVCLHRSGGKLLSREWFYTAVTRARENVVVLTNVIARDVALERGEYPAGPAARKAEWLIDKMVNNDRYNIVAKMVPDRSEFDATKVRG